MSIHSQDLDCHGLMLNIPITANNYVLDIKKATTETELAEFVDGLDRDATIDRKHCSYVYAAVNAGYTVLNYDRLGNLFSEKPDPFDAITNAFLVQYGHLSSAAILTGFTFSLKNGRVPGAVYALVQAAPANPALFAFYPAEYFTMASRNTLQTVFLHRNSVTDPAGFTDEVLAYAESIKAPIASGAALETRGLISGGVAKDFNGPMQHFLGEFNYLVCWGNCKGDYSDEDLVEVDPAASVGETYIQPGAGYGLPCIGTLALGMRSRWAS
ncbi:hypothetical protein B0A48_16030 [Cryoendolithus antarcticus]|uniref:Uncharacterized protein n=1 Tax=Cryoendolithus antarcticus TaxID=1507870 RepID=A0A1V8SFF5_9PEZI|nr:hypothetical protein B0A48_16030 [Cryoendolithus antarcticus]